MIKEVVDINDVVALLNDAYSLDPDAINELINTRVKCNLNMANHPTIQVMGNKEQTEFKVGIIGILNGIFGIADDGMGAIASNYEVICPNGHKVPDDATVYKTCTECGEKLKMGKLLEFLRIR